MKNKTFLCVFESLFCMGCCIADRHYPTKKQLTNAIKQNTFVFKDFDNIKDFSKRKESGHLRKCGVCNNQIFKRKKVLCPLHPGNNKGKDMRKRKFCYKDFTCDTLDEFNEWNSTLKKDFLKFIKLKKPDWYQYSINIDNGAYLKEFKKSKDL